MARLFRWLLRIFTAMVLLAGLSLGLIYWIASRSLPDYNARFTLAGISGPVEIIRDNADVPHILGASDNDVLFALGFVHAQDRLWQMMLLRRTAQGRLSEVFGKRTLKTDELMRRLDIYRLALSSAKHLAPETQMALQAYANGVNAWLETVNQQALGRGAPEFFIFNNEIAPWQPADSIALEKLRALKMSSQAEYEVLLAQVSLLLPPERVRDIMPEAPGAGVAELPEYSALFDTLPEYASTSPPPAPDPLFPLPPTPFAGASNAWAAAPSRSATGATLLANDPHSLLSAPAPWYLAHLGLSSGGVIGATIPGIPGILAGRSDNLGWGITTAFVDDQDILIEKLNPANNNEVLTPDGYKPLKTRQSIIRIKGEPAETIILKWSENGPILPRDLFGLSAIIPKGHVAALAWTALDPADSSMTYIQKIMQAKSIEEAISAGAFHVAPAQNLVLADKNGIAMKTIGRIPRRADASQSQGRLPQPGWLEDNRWQGMLNYSSNPEFLSPVGGILGNTNNKMLDRPFPLNVSFHWGDTQRVQRWRKLMQNREVHTRDSFVEAQLDTVSFTARSLLPLVARNLWFTGDAAPAGTPERLRQRALKMLADWNGEMDEHMPEPLIYAAWMRALQDRLIRDELGPIARRFTHVEPVFIERVFRDIDGASRWCDVIQSAPVESCTDIARLSLDDALIWIGENYGKNLEALRWGDAHIATQDHNALGSVPVLKYFVNIHQSTSGGDNTLMRGLTSGSGPMPFLNVHAAAYRGVYDLGDPDSSLFVISTGQSGHFLSRYYDNMSDLWRRGEYIPMSLDPELARAAAVGITHLVPAK